MDSSRWPRMCLDRLVYRASQSANPEYNWVARVRVLLKPFNITFPTSTPPQEVTTAVWQWSRSQDKARAIASSYCLIYGKLAPIDTVAIPSGLNLREMRVIIQVVAQNRLFQSLFWRGAAVAFAPSSPCPCCRSGQFDTIDHMITSCPAYEHQRRQSGLSVHLPLVEVLSAVDGMTNVLSFLKASWSKCVWERSRTPLNGVIPLPSLPLSYPLQALLTLPSL